MDNMLTVQGVQSQGLLPGMAQCLRDRQRLAQLLAQLTTCQMLLDDISPIGDHAMTKRLHHVGMMYLPDFGVLVDKVSPPVFGNRLKINQLHDTTQVVG